jgi:hypothetical protein
MSLHSLAPPFRRRRTSGRKGICAFAPARRWQAASLASRLQLTFVLSATLCASAPLQAGQRSSGEIRRDAVDSGTSLLTAENATIAGPRRSRTPVRQAKNAELPRVILYVPELDDSDLDDSVQATSAAYLCKSEVEAQFVRRPRAEFSLVALAASLETLASENSPRAFIWLNVSRAQGFELYVFDPRARGSDFPLGLFRRRLPYGNAEAAAGVEALAIIAQSVVDSIAEGVDVELEAVTPSEVEAAVAEEQPAASPAPVSPSPDPVPEAATSARSAPSRPPELLAHLEVGAEYSGNTFASEKKWQHGVGVDLVFRPIRPIAVDLRYAWVQAVRHAQAPLDALVVRRHPVSLGVSAIRRLKRVSAIRDLEFAFRFHITLDPVVRSATANDESLGRETRLSWASGGDFALRWWLTPRFAVLGSFGVEYAFKRAEYLVNLNATGQSMLVLSPDPVRALATLGFRFGLGRW